MVTNFSPSDWEDLIRSCRASELLAHVASLLRERGLWSSVPEAPRRHLRSGELVCRRQHEELAFEVQEISRALASLRIPVVLLKGAAYVCANNLAGRGRMVSDVDILVPREALPEVESALMVAGWRSASTSAYDQRYYRTWMHELPPMVHIQRGTVVDVHHAILPSTARLHPSSQKLIDRSVPLVDFEGLRVLAPEDMLLHSATHLMHEGTFEQGFRGLVDLAALLGVCDRHGITDRDLICRAIELELAGPLFHSLRQMSRQLQVQVSALLLRELRQAVRVSDVGLWCLHAMLDRVLGAHPSQAKDIRFSLATQVMYLRGHWLRMPPWLLAYHLLRKAVTPREH